MKTNVTTSNIVGAKLVILLTFLSQSFLLSVHRPSHVFSSNNSLYLTRLRGKSFPREGQSAVPPRGLIIFWCIVWCIYSRFSIFLPKRPMFSQIIRTTQLDTPCLQQFRKKKTCYDCLLFEKKITMRVRRRFHEANIVVIPCKRPQHCCATLRRSQNKRNVGTCCAKSLTGFKLYATSANKCQHCCGSMQTDVIC